MNQGVFGKFSGLSVEVDIKCVIFFKQTVRFQENAAARVEGKGDGFLEADRPNKQGCILVGEIDFLDTSAMVLIKMITLNVFSDAGMKVVDNFFVFETTVAIVPTTLPVEPEDRLLLRNNHEFGCFHHGSNHLL